MTEDLLLERVIQLEQQVRELQTPDTVSMFKIVKRQNKAAVDRRYRQKAQKVTREWDFSQKECDCPTAEDEPHKQIRFRSTDDKFYVCCPIRFFMLHCWKALTEKIEYPTQDWLRELMGKENKP